MQYLTLFIFIFLTSHNAFTLFQSKDEKLKKSIQARMPNLGILYTKKKDRLLGSGFLISKTQMITNSHVVNSMPDAYIKFENDPYKYKYSILKQSQKLDLALIQLDKEKSTNSPTNVKRFAEIVRGDFVFALGAPDGYEYSASYGIVSASHRQLDDANANSHYIQIDAPLHHGSSGGPVYNLDGKFIGVAARGSASGTMAFVIPAQIVSKFLVD